MHQREAGNDPVSFSHPTYRMEFVQYFEEFLVSVSSDRTAFSMDPLKVLGAVLQTTYHM